ncbi:MAG TPA: hypothetical protein VH969_07710 [Actinophytocola sp.]|jgi:hypothetical protein
MTTFDPHPIYTELVNEGRARGVDPALPEAAGEPDHERPEEIVPV